MTIQSLRMAMLLLACVGGLLAPDACAQNSVARSSTFDMGSGFPATANNRLQSVVGQTIVGQSRSGNALLTGGFLVDSLSWSRVTGVDGSGSQGFPLTFELLQNYPNPFNPTTVLSWQVPVVSNVKLAVYDILGREVATIVNEVRSPGSYKVTWNAAGLASGVYLYRLTAGSFTETKKMILLR
jgi:hypothetical protein